MHREPLSYDEVKKANDEAFMHWTLHDFQVLLETRGIDIVFKAMPEDLYWQIYKYFGG